MKEYGELDDSTEGYHLRQLILISPPPAKKSGTFFLLVIFMRREFGRGSPKRHALLLKSTVATS